MRRAQLAHRARAERDEIDAVELDGARGRLDEAKDHAAGRRLAAARFADEAERFAGHHVERDAVDGAHGAAGLPNSPFLIGKCLARLANREQRRVRRRRLDATRRRHRAALDDERLVRMSARRSGSSAR